MDALIRAVTRLAARLTYLEPRLRDDDDAIWREYRDTLAVLAQITPLTLPGATGKLLTSAELAARLGVSTRTLRRKAKAGVLTPVPLGGRAVRWHRDAAASR